MSTWAEEPTVSPTTSGKRYPFLALFGLACGGIGLGESLVSYFYNSYKSFFALTAFAIGCLLVSLWGKGKSVFPFAVLLSFACHHAGGLLFSQSFLLSRTLGEKPIAVEVIAIVTSEPKQTPGGWRFHAQVAKLRSLPTADHPLPDWIPLNIKVSALWKEEKPPSFGNHFHGLATLEPLPPSRNPGQFNLRTWYLRKGIRHQLTLASENPPRILANDPLPVVLVWANAAKNWVRSTLSHGIEKYPTPVSLIQAMTIGDTSGLESGILNNFRVSGTMHLFSVSGLHVTILAVIFYLSLRPLQFPPLVLAIIISILLFFYSAVTGLKAASLRAAFMASVLLVSSATLRPSSALNSLGGAGFFLLLLDSQQLFEAGFQLSFAVVGTILVLSRFFQEWMTAPFSPDPFIPPRFYTPLERIRFVAAKQCSMLLAVSVAAWIGSLPLIAYYYQFVSFSAIPANLLAAPIAFVILSTSMLSLIAAGLSGWFISVFNHANLLFSFVMLGIVEFATALPYSWVSIRELLPKKHDAEVVFFDYGAGDCVAFRSGQQIALLDTGSIYNWRSSLSGWLTTYGNRVDALVLTHGDTYHVSAAPLAVELAHVERVFFGKAPIRSPYLKQTLALLEPRETESRQVSSNFSVTLGKNFDFSILFPPHDWQFTSADSGALVTKWRINGVSVLSLSDAGALAEEWLMKNKPHDLQADILTLGVNTDRLPNYPEFLDFVRPRVVIASVADFPPGEFLPRSYIRSISARGIVFLPKDKTGAVILTIDKNVVKIKNFVDKEIVFCWQISP